MLKPITLTGLVLGWSFWFVSAPNPARARPVQSAAAEPVIKTFNERLKQYLKLREQATSTLSKLSTESTPAEINAHLVSLRANIVVARPLAKPGEILSAEVARELRAIIQREFTGQRRRQLREDVLKADTKGVQVQVNAPYPQTKELVEMPPTLLLKLPTLPPQLHYRFVGTSLVLMDKEARLIIDYMPNALP